MVRARAATFITIIVLSILVLSAPLYSHADVEDALNARITQLPSDANQFSPPNYYTPLGALSTGATYGLGTLAMVIGILGALLIIRDPAKEKIRWTPHTTANRPLLKP